MSSRPGDVLSSPDRVVWRTWQALAPANALLISLALLMAVLAAVGGIGSARDGDWSNAGWAAVFPAAALLLAIYAVRYRVVVDEVGITTIGVRRTCRGWPEIVTLVRRPVRGRRSTVFVVLDDGTARELCLLRDADSFVERALSLQPVARQLHDSTRSDEVAAPLLLRPGNSELYACAMTGLLSVLLIPLLWNESRVAGLLFAAMGVVGSMLLALRRPRTEVRIDSRGIWHVPIGRRDRPQELVCDFRDVDRVLPVCVGAPTWSVAIVKDDELTLVWLPAEKGALAPRFLTRARAVRLAAQIDALRSLASA